MIRFIAIVSLLFTAASGAQSKKLFPGLPVQNDQEHTGIRILDARYGKDELTCRPAEKVADACNGQASCSIDASDDLCGNPYTNVDKNLVIAYQCYADERRTVVVAQGATAHVFCAGVVPDQTADNEPPAATPPRGWVRDRIYVVGASYGVSNYTCDATEYFSQRCDGHDVCTVTVNNQMCGDPAHGERKSAVFTWWCNGERRQSELRENQTSTFTCR